MKRIISAILSVLMIVTICGTTTSCDSSSTSAGKIGVVEGSEYGKYEKTVTFSTVRPGYPVNWPEGMDITHNPFWDVIREELNVDCNVLWDSSGYNEKLLLDISAGNVPDIFMVDDYATYRQLYLSGMLEDLTDVYEEYATDSIKERYATYGPDNYAFRDVTENGRIMALPSTTNGYQEPLLWIRKDWLDQLNLEVPTTIEEIANVAEAFVTQDPGGNGPGNTVGIAINSVNVFTEDGFFTLTPLANAMGAFPKKWMTDENGKVYYGSTSPEMKQVMQTVLDWNNRGIFGKSAFTQTWEETANLVNTGRAGMWFFGWSWPLDGEFIKNNPRAEVIAVNAPLDSDGKFTYASTAPATNWLCVRKGFEYPEIVFKIFQIYEDVNKGKYPEKLEQLQELWDSGVFWYVLSPLAGYSVVADDQIPEGAKELGAYLENGTLPEGGISGNNKVIFDRSKAWLTDGLSATDYHLNWGYYMGRYVGSLASGTELCNPVRPAYFYKTDSMLDSWSMLSAMEYNMIAQILTGVDDIAYFDYFVQDWKEAGGDTILQEIQAIIDEK